MDVARGTPRVLAESVAEAAPEFISRGSIATAGALKGLKAAAPLIKGFGRGVGSVAESLSGLEHKTPGVLADAASDATLIFGKGKKAAGQVYQKVLDPNAIPKSFGDMPSKDKLFEEAQKLVKREKLTPEGAFEARKNLDEIENTLPETTYRKWRNIFDILAKKKTAAADPGYQRAIKSEALRLPLAQNKYGGTSAWKLGIFSGLGGVGAGLSPLAAIPLALTSPAVQGAAATGIGLGARTLAQSPVRAGLTSGAIQALRNRRKK